MRILVYTPTNSRAVDLQSVMELFSKMGHEVYLLSQLPEGDLHRNVRKYGVKTYSYPVSGRGFSGFYKHARFFVRFIRQHKIDTVFAHLQGAGLVAGIARKLIRFNYFYVRHNTDEHKLQHSRNAAIINWVTNILASKIIAPSGKVYRYMTVTEKINPSKVIRINYGYNFSQYLQTDKTGNAGMIRQQFQCSMLIISVARLIPVKRHLLMFDAVKKMLDKSADIKMICLSDGPYRAALQAFIDENSLQQNIFLLGSKANVFDYLEASDIFFHLSETEASNSAVKEAGFCRKSAIVCNDVGDFDDYIQEGVNGFIADKTNPVNQSVFILDKLYNEPERLITLGNNLYNTIMKEFSIENVALFYRQILETGDKVKS